LMLAPVIRRPLTWRIGMTAPVIERAGAVSHRQAEPKCHATEKGPPTKAVLIESDSDPSFCAPYNTAGEPRTICHEYELIRDANKTRDVKLGSDVRSIPNYAGEGAAAELNGSSLEDTMARGFTLLHGWRS